MKRKFLAFTGGRSDYDLMSGVFAAIHQSTDMELGLVVTGTHLSTKHGQTIKEIQKDGFNIVGQIQTLENSDSTNSRAIAAGRILSQGGQLVESWKPDAILFAGDREEVIAASVLATYLAIPSIHFYGGDHASDGNTDNPIRHATSKLSSLHFVTIPEHRDRLVKMGELKSRIFVTGNPAIDRFKSIPVMSQADVLKAMNRPNFKEYAVVVFHPEITSYKEAGKQTNTILEALHKKKMPAFVSAPNSDPGNFAILAEMERWKSNELFSFYSNLERGLFVNLLRNSRLLIGNSSLGLLEAPSIPLPVVNVGARQRGRLAAKNVIFVEAEQAAVKNAIEQALSPDMREDLKGIENPYGDGHSIPRILEALKTIDLNKYLLKTEDALK